MRLSVRQRGITIVLKRYAQGSMRPTRSISLKRRSRSAGSQKKPEVYKRTDRSGEGLEKGVALLEGG